MPSIKKAVHHVTAPRSASKATRRASAGPAATAQRREDCVPVPGGPLPEVPLVTYASPIEDDPAVGGGTFSGGSVPISAAVGIGSGGGGTSVAPPAPLNPGAGAIPEPSAWIMMILGVGTLGAGLRLRRRRASLPAHGVGGVAGRGVAGGAFWSGSVAVEAGDMATTVAVKSAVASAAGKAMLCVCPAAIVAGSVMTVPPLRQAVHASTAGPEAAGPGRSVPTQMAQPCSDAMTVPVASTAVEGFPASVQTMTVPEQVTVSTPAEPSRDMPQTI